MSPQNARENLKQSIFSNSHPIVIRQSEYQPQVKSIADRLSEDFTSPRQKTKQTLASMELNRRELEIGRLKDFGRLCGEISAVMRGRKNPEFGFWDFGVRDDDMVWCDVLRLDVLRRYNDGCAQDCSGGVG
jgi:hypothetical protein